MIKVYGTNTCPDCVHIYPQLNGTFVYIDICEHVHTLKEFIRLRDANPIFDKCKQNGTLGIPCFVLEDGTVTLAPEDVGLKSRMDEGKSCDLSSRNC